MSATGAVAVVTGGAGAIGSAVCQRLAAAGHRVVVVDLAGACGASRRRRSWRAMAIAGSVSTSPTPTPWPRRSARWPTRSDRSRC